MRQAFQLDVQTVGLDEVIRNLSTTWPKEAERARKSALKSTGWWIRGEVRDHIESGAAWPRLHHLTKTRRKSKDGTRWEPAHKHTPLAWLGRFVRYRLDERGEAVHIGLGKSRTGQEGAFDKALDEIAKKHEFGRKIKVSGRMRRKIAAARFGRPDRAAAKRLGRRGVDPRKNPYALRKDTKYLNIPARPTFGPVFQRVRAQIPQYMRDKFWAAFNRYQREV